MLFSNLKQFYLFPNVFFLAKFTVKVILICLLRSLLVKIKHLLRNKLFNKYLSFIFIVQWCLSWWGKKNRKILNHYLPAVRSISINFNKCYRKNPLFLIFLYHFQMEIRTHFIIDWAKKNASLNYICWQWHLKKPMISAVFNSEFLHESKY